MFSGSSTYRCAGSAGCWQGYHLTDDLPESRCRSRDAGQCDAEGKQLSCLRSWGVQYQWRSGPHRYVGRTCPEQAGFYVLLSVYK